jgi:pyruvate/2-oxoglutarate dehydrogenase complex dihydrolipoamide dehydrogenase (E3) component
VGGGYIALEFASIFHGLGVKTTLTYRGKRLLRGFDAELGTRIAEEMARKGSTSASAASRARSHEGRTARDRVHRRPHRRNRPRAVRHRPAAEHRQARARAAA